MGKEWIDNLAQDIRQKGHEAAENYGKAQHQAEIAKTQGRPFFTTFAMALEEDVNEIKRRFDARITYQDPTVVLDYVKGLGVAGDPALDRKSCHFTFHVAEDDSLSIQESFGDQPRQFHQPEDLAQHIVQLLFQL